MNVGVVDVGSNTVRLLVSRHGRPILGDRAALGLGAAVEEHGAIPEAKLAETADTAGRFVAAARAAGAVAVEVLVASPGRQAANAADLVEALAAATRAPVRVLSAAEEGRLAFDGAVHSLRLPARQAVAVVDVGGGSAQVSVGTRRNGVAWTQSIDLGSLRLTRRCLPDDPPGPEAVALARLEVERALAGFDPPAAEIALAVGGSARAVRRIAGDVVGVGELAAAVQIATRTPAEELVARYGMNPTRGRTVVAGAVILAAIQGRLDLPLHVARAGLREGAILDIRSRSVAAAA